MHSDKEYHLFIQRPLKILIFGMLTLFAVIGFLMLTGMFSFISWKRTTAICRSDLDLYGDLEFVLGAHSTPSRDPRYFALPVQTHSLNPVLEVG